MLQADLNQLSTWSDKNYLQLNPTKCKFMSITRKHSPYHSSYHIDNSPLEKVDSLSLLGVTVSKDLKWGNHVNGVTARSNKLLGFIRHVAGESHPDVLLQLYRTMFLPILDYCAPVWSPHTTKLNTSIERVQRTATRTILHQSCREQEYDDRLVRLDLGYLSQRREYMSIHVLLQNACPLLGAVNPCLLWKRSDPIPGILITLNFTIFKLEQMLFISMQFKVFLRSDPTCRIILQTPSCAIILTISNSIFVSILRVSNSYSMCNMSFTILWVGAGHLMCTFYSHVFF